MLNTRPLLSFFPVLDNFSSNISSCSTASEVPIYALYDFSHERPPTALGQRQGDHTSAYALFCKAIEMSIENCRIEAASIRLFEIMACLEGSLHPLSTQFMQSSLVEHLRSRSAAAAAAASGDSGSTESHEKEKAEKFSEQITRIRNQLTAIRGDMVRQEKTDHASPPSPSEEKSHLRNNIQDFKDIIICMATLYLTTRNRMPYVSFPREGNIPAAANEGSQVKIGLQRLSQHDKYCEDLNSQILDRDVITQISQCMYLPLNYKSVPRGTLINLTTPEGQQKWQPLKRKYKKGTRPRDNDLKILNRVLANHIDLIFTCYRSFFKYQNQIIEGFLNLIARKWRVNYTTFARGVIDELHKLSIHYKLGNREASSSSESEETTGHTSESDGSSAPPPHKGLKTSHEMDDKPSNGKQLRHFESYMKIEAAAEANREKQQRQQASTSAAARIDDGDHISDEDYDDETDEDCLPSSSTEPASATTTVDTTMVGKSAAIAPPSSPVPQ